MAECQTAKNLEAQAGAWAAMQLAAHAKRCLLCRLIKIESQQGGIPPEIVKTYGLQIYERPRNAWIGQSAYKAAVYEDQWLKPKEP